MKNKKIELRLGFLINPVAGAGGPAGLKGSDAEATRNAFYSGEITSLAGARALLFFNALDADLHRINILCASGAMGSEVLDGAEVNYELVNCVTKEQSDREDTIVVCKAMLNQGVDILVFAGGDGTARDVFDAVGDKVLCLGIPSGVKMQSAVFGIHPRASAEVIRALLNGQAVTVQMREVRDIDEAALVQGKVNSRFYGELKIPVVDGLVQQVKQGAGGVDELLIADIADEIRERLRDLHGEAVLVFGPGSTTFEVQKELGYDATLLGVDVVISGKCSLDLSEQKLRVLLSENKLENIRLILTFIGGQGHIIGRGNQQLSPEVLNLVGRDNVWLIATPQKLQSLNGCSILIDSGSEMLNESWRGLIEVITGYQKISLHRIS